MSNLINKITLVFSILLSAFSLSCDKVNNPIDDGRTPPCLECPVNFRLTDFEPAWSPDGKTIAYIHGDTSAEATGIYFINADGSNKRLFLSSVSASTPDWSPNGEWLVFEMNSNIYKIKVNGDSLTQLTFEGRNFFPSWSSDEKHIAFSRSLCSGPNTCGIWIIGSGGANSKFLVDYGKYPDWHYSVSKVLYLTSAVTQQGQTVGDTLWTHDINTNVKHIIKFLNGNNGDNSYPKYSPSGVKIALTSQPAGIASQTHIWIMNSDGTNLQQLTNTLGYSCDWSPTGEWIVYTNSDTSSGRLWLIRSDGSENHSLSY